jgi:putative heme-binding domain-containing protein
VTILDAFARRHPDLAGALKAAGDDDPAAWSATMGRVDWDAGDPGRGASVFRARQCASCHEGATAMGPDLAGVGRRLSREDLFAAMVAPSRDVAPAYRPLVVETADGRAIAGVLVFESAEALIVRTGPSTIERIDGLSIASRRTGTTSLMPAGLLRGATEKELADVYAYLKSL